MNSSKPKVSFVLPSHNSAAWLAHSIESCQKQSYPDIEIVVVDDASTDSTRLLMDFLCAKDKRIRNIRLPKNAGRSVARNIGNAEAAGEIIAVLDADDIAYPNRARMTVEALKHSDFVHGSCEYIDALGNRLGEHRADVFNKDLAIKDKLNRVVHSTCAYRKTLAERIKYRGGELADLGLDDWAFQLEVAFSGAKMEHIVPIIGAYRELPTGISKRRDPEKVEAAKIAFIESLKVPA